MKIKKKKKKIRSTNTSAKRHFKNKCVVRFIINEKKNCDKLSYKISNEKKIFQVRHGLFETQTIITKKKF